mmetsp:Transcript_2494/g.7504  ORF Transcript_2494/g.7504 Transcript_2494/m.7504 type:complete len:238 (+) Transcript_2494:419-1132(+)
MLSSAQSGVCNHAATVAAAPAGRRWWVRWFDPGARPGLLAGAVCMGGWAGARSPGWVAHAAHGHLRPCVSECSLAHLLGELATVVAGWGVAAAPDGAVVAPGHGAPHLLRPLPHHLSEVTGAGAKAGVLEVVQGRLVQPQVDGGCPVPGARSQILAIAEGQEGACVVPEAASLCEAVGSFGNGATPGELRSAIAGTHLVVAGHNFPLNPAVRDPGFGTGDGRQHADRCDEETPGCHG